MRIAGNKTQQPNLALDSSQRSERGAKTSEAAAAASAAGTATDTVQLSKSSSAVHKALASDDAARAARIAEVKAQIESGGYPLDFAGLAERIIDDELGRSAG